MSGRPIRLDQNKHRWSPDDSIRGRKADAMRKRKMREKRKHQEASVSFLLNNGLVNGAQRVEKGAEDLDQQFLL